MECLYEASSSIIVYLVSSQDTKQVRMCGCGVQSILLLPAIFSFQEGLDIMSSPGV